MLQTLQISRLWTQKARAAPLTANTLQARYKETLWRYAAARLGGTPEAEDVVAETFAAAFQRLHKCPKPPESPDAEHDPVRAWLIAIARSKVVDTLRRTQRHATAPLHESLADGRPSPEAAALTQEAAAELDALLDTLPALQREAVLLKYVDELSLIEIGKALGKSPNAVGQLLHRARQTLRERGSHYFLIEIEEETR
jgi:RNA polymerase sigma-70 factor, ECF subfamily